MTKSRKWKKSGTAILLTAAVAASCTWPAGGLLTALASTPVTEYDEETLAKFADNVLEYWEIPGLIEQYNTTFRNQLETFYNNPDGSTGLTKTQLLDLAKELRDEAAELTNESDDLKDEITKEEYKDYQDNIRALRQYATSLEQAADGKSAAGAAAIWGLRVTREQQTRAASALMREYQSLVSEDEIKRKELEIANAALQTARTKQALQMFTAEDVQNAEEAANAAQAASTAASAALKSKKQNLLTMLGWKYDAEPEIMAVPEPDLAKLSGFSPESDTELAVNNNYTLRSTRNTPSKSSGGRDQKARTIQDQENQVRMAMDLLYRDVMQKKAAYDAACTEFAVAESNKAAADRLRATGQTSRQEDMQNEVAYLIARADKEAAGLALIGRMEDYEWAVKGNLDIGGDGA